jgi:GNAT superfamily N-acetyltransferase
MAAAEEEGRRRGCTAVWLDTFEFQARPFYEKLGYSNFGTLDYPAGFKRFFLQKAL